MKELITETADFSNLKDVLDRIVLFNSKSETFSNIIFNLKNGRELISCPYKGVAAKNDFLYYCLDWDFNKRRQSDTLSIIPLSEITSLSILNFETVAPAFMKSDSTLSPIGGLQLKRLVEQTSASLSDIAGQSIQIKADETDSENGKINLNKILNLLPVIFKEITKDDFSRKAVSEKLSSIKITDGSCLLVSLEGRAMVIQFNINDNSPNFKLKSVLTEGIESVL